MNDVDLAKLLEDRVLPLLVRLGDFIGNGESHPVLGELDRCATILEVRGAIDKLKERHAPR